MAQALTLLESITSTPSGSTHTTKTLMQPSYIQNTTASACTMNVDAPHKYAVFKTGTTNGNLINAVPRAFLRKVYASSTSTTGAAITLDGVDTGANAAVGIGAIKYLNAGADVTAATTITGTLTTGVSAQAVGEAAEAHVDNGGEALLVDYVVADVAGTMTLTSVTIVNKMRDYAVGNTISFLITGQDAGVIATITITAAHLSANSIELTSLYVHSVSSQTIRVQAATELNITFATPDPDFDYTFNASPNNLVLTEDVVVLPGATTPFLTGRFKVATSSTTFTFNTLI